MADNRTVEQRLAAVAASMTMAGYTMTETDRASPGGSFGVRFRRTSRSVGS